MILSNHTKERMQKKGISKDEIIACIEHGSKEIEGFMHGEYRYGKRLELKHKTIFVIYTHVGDEKRVITCFNEKRKSRK